MPFASHAGAVKKVPAKPAQVTILTSAQSAASSGRIKVKVSPPVKTSPAGKLAKKARKAKRGVVLVLTVKQPWSSKINGPKIHFRTSSARPKTVITKIPSAARTLIRNCGAPSITAHVTGKRTGGMKAFSKKTRRKLKKDASKCKVPADVDLSSADTCDFIAAPGNSCLAPFPNDFYTRSDPGSATGRRVNLPANSTPMNKEGVHIGVDELNESDGFSPGPLISIRIPGLETQPAFDQSGLVSLTSMSKAFDPNQSIVLIDAATGERQLIWAELDAQATSDAARNLLIRPGKNLANGHRYIVAMRGLKTVTGEAFVPPAAFRS